MCVCEKALFIRLWMLDYEVGFYSTSNLNPCIALYVNIFSSGSYHAFIDSVPNQVKFSLYYSDTFKAVVLVQCY